MDKHRFFELMGGHSIYEVVSPTHLIEIQVIGKRYVRHELHARIFPEKQLIHDVLNDSTRYHELTAEEFRLKEKEITENYISL